LEIVSEPDINSPHQAYDYLLNLKSILKYIGASTCDMEKGILRCDANISVSKEKNLGVKVELKNMNTFKGVKEALEYEIKRQMDLIKRGKRIIQETRLWDEAKKRTISMRTKEEAQDYRYFPEPDLVPFMIEEEYIQRLRESLPELPRERLNRFVQNLKLPTSSASVLTSEKKLADYFEACLLLYPNAKNLSNWITTVLLAEINRRDSSIEELNLEPERFVRLIRLVDEGRLSNLRAKDVLVYMLDSGKDPQEIIYEKDLVQIEDKDLLKDIVDTILRENQNTVSDYLKGKEKALSFLIGQVMKRSKGKANPKRVSQILRERLEGIK
jgi:aspartyl-tRNA(Asn)/glutamyl-tRNA(Gln) amidotransferase subunit B